jgi:hypothetical protein
MQILSMPQINRERGSISEPCVRDSHHQGTFVHCSQIPKQVDYYGHEEYRYIADQDTEYGIGVWPYKPCFSIKVDHCQGFQRDNIGMCKLIAQTGVADWTNQPWTWSETDHPDQFSLPVEEKIHLNNKLESRLPSIAAGMPDLFVFFKELGDIKGTFDFLKERTLSKKISGAHLSYSFGIRPFIADIKKIILKLDNWQDRIETIQKGIGKVHDLSVATSWDGPSTSSSVAEPCWYARQGNCSPEVGNHLNCRLLGNYLTGTDSYAKYSAQLTVKYRYSWPSELDVTHSFVKSFLTANRLLPDASSLWEITPFSFVVDWVANTDKLFSKLGLDGLGFDCVTSIVDACLTVKVKRYRKSYFPQDHCFEERSTLTTREELFYRWTGKHALDRLDWNFKLPNLMQFLLGGSLVNCLRH